MWSRALKPKLVLHRWHFGMLELQPIYLLVTALGSRLAVPSNLAIATFDGKSDYQINNMSINKETPVLSTAYALPTDFYLLHYSYQ